MIKLRRAKIANFMKGFRSGRIGGHASRRGKSCACLLVYLLCSKAQPSLASDTLQESRSAAEQSWRGALSEETHRQSFPYFVETSASGLAALSIGIYGASFDHRGFVTTSVYSLLQTGGVILISEGLRDYLSTSYLLEVDRAFEHSPSMSRKQFQRIWRKAQINNVRSNQWADLFLWSGLTGVYLAASAKEPHSGSTMRSIYLFLATNGALLSGVAAYGLFSEPQNSAMLPKTGSPDLAFTGGGVALAWKWRW